MFQLKKDKNMFKKLVIAFLISLLVLGIAGAALAFWFFNGNLKQKIAEKTTNKIINEITTNNLDDKNVFQEALGFHGVKKYLVLFLNNTELRPGGGFVGAYAIIKVDKGLPEVVKIDGTENLNTPKKDFEPPKPIKDYLGLESWELRDSNWSPDFASSSEKSLQIYAKAKGLLSDDMDAVIGFTPTVFENVLKITGPFTYAGITFDSSNFTEKLEYEVEYNYKNKGIRFQDRKMIMGGIMREMMKKLTVDVLFKWGTYSEMITKMAEQKHIMLYSSSSSTQRLIEYKDLGGRVKNTNDDYLMWVDANLGALKTDAAIKREISYSFSPESNGKYLAKVKMKYKHNGSFDWRTTRYRTYARIYVPKSSTYKDVKLNNMRGDKKVDQGVELNKQWFGTFVSVEPGQTGEVEYQFYLSKDIVNQIKNGDYKLSVQKQLGTVDSKLILDLNFGQQVVSATPAEDKKYFNDKKYNLNTDLKTDRKFKVKF
jgi:hypothetical protein